MRLLRAILGLGLSANVAHAVAAWTPPADPHRSIILSNRYGDMVEFDLDTVTVGPSNVVAIDWGPPRVSAGQPVPTEPKRQFYYLQPRTHSVGLVLLATSPATSPQPSPAALIERLAVDGLRPHITSIFPDTFRDLAILEPGCFDDRSMRWPCGWDLKARVGPLPRVRMTFVVVGRPAGGPDVHRAADGVPVPIRDAGPLRPYDLSPVEVSATARVVGDLIVDFDRRELVPLKAPGTTVLTNAAHPWSNGVSSRAPARVTEYHWQAHYRDHVVPSDVALVDADGDGRAELVRVRVRIHQPKGLDWVLSPVRLGVHPEQLDDSIVMGGAVGSLALDARIRGPRVGQKFSTKDSSEVELEFEFDAEEVRLKLGGRAGALLFDVHRMLSVETASPDGDRYRSEVAPIPSARLGWLPGRLLGVGAAISEGRVEFSTRIEADRDADCPIRASAIGVSRQGWVDSLVVIPVKAGVTPATFSIALPPGLPSELDSVMLQLHVTDIHGPLFAGKFWQRGAMALQRGGR